MPDPYWENVAKETAEKRSRMFAAGGGRYRRTIIESGGHKAGQAVRKLKDGTEHYWCPSCQKRQSETKLARGRAQRVRCRECGLVIYPMKKVSSREKEKKQCNECEAPLRMGNITGFCSLCEKKYEGQEPWRRWQVALEKNEHVFEGSPLRCVSCKASIGKLAERGDRKGEVPGCKGKLAK